ncbi:MAG: hypothetical protein Q4C47_03230, partial [Planctomycetia bacterium]|nr:hypothetical protein [Planctomycetia bacterium]
MNVFHRAPDMSDMDEGSLVRGWRGLVMEWFFRIFLTFLAMGCVWWGLTQGDRCARKYRLPDDVDPATVSARLRLGKSPEWRPIFRGVDLARIEESGPVPRKILVIRADLQASGVRPTVSQPDFVTEKNAYMINRRTSTTLKEYGFAVALGAKELKFPEDSFISQAGLVQKAKVSEDLRHGTRRYTGTKLCDPETFDAERYLEYQGVGRDFIVEKRSGNIRRYMFTHPGHLGWGLWDDIMIG